MREELIKASLDGIVLSDTASKRILDHVMKKYAENKKRTARVRIAVPAAACAALAAGAGISGAVLFRKSTDIISETEIGQTDGTDKSGDGLFDFTAQLLPDVKIELCGASLGDAEGRAYLCENEGSVKSSLLASGVPVGDMRISEHGYRHINCGSGSRCFINLGFRDYLIYSGDELISVVTVTKDDDGRMGLSVSFGADEYYRSLDGFLSSHRGEKMIFLYAGSLEVILTESSEPFCAGHDAAALFEDVTDPYERFYNDEAVFTP